MRRRLYPTVPVADGESPASHVSRLARCNFVRSARQFCSDMGFSFQHVVDGDRETLKGIADLAWMSPDALLLNALVRAPDGWRLRGERLTKPSLRRDRLHVCPACLAADVATSGHPAALAVYGRVTWLISHVRTCPLHGVALVEVGGDLDRDTVHDFSARVGPASERLERLADAAERRPASALENYLLGRLAGAPSPSPWLDGLEFHAAAKFCEMLGAVALHGRTPQLNGLSDADWQAAGGVGFDIASGGEAGVWEFLRGLQTSYRCAKGGKEKANAFFGRLYQWLANAADPSFEPLRDLIRRYAVENMALAPDDLLFGQPVEKRRLHSLYTASREYGIHPTRLRNILASRGMLPPDHADRTDNLVYFGAEIAGGLLAKLADSISLKVVEKYLNAGRVHARLLADNGLIVPVVTGGAPGIGDHAFARADLDAFMARLLAGTVPVAEPTDKVCDIPKAAKLSNCGGMEVVRLILDRKLVWVGRRTDVGGYLSILVDASEVKRLVRGLPFDGMALIVVERELKSSYYVVKALVEHGHLPVRRVLNPASRHAIQLVDRKDLEAFRAKYVALAELAAERGVNLRKVLVELRDMGVHPALDPAIYKARFYRRKDIVSA